MREQNEFKINIQKPQEDNNNRDLIYQYARLNHLLASENNIEEEIPSMKTLEKELISRGKNPPTTEEIEKIVNKINSENEKRGNIEEIVNKINKAIERFENNKLTPPQE